MLSHDEAEVGLPTEIADRGEIRGGLAPPSLGLAGGEEDDEAAWLSAALFWKALRPRRPL